MVCEYHMTITNAARHVPTAQSAGEMPDCLIHAPSQS